MSRSLGQDLWYPGAPMIPLPEQETPAAAQDITDAEATTFSSYWDRFTAIWPDFLRLSGEIAGQQGRWQVLATTAYTRGDAEGYRSFQERARALDAIEAERLSIEDTILRFKDTWEALKTYLSQLGRWFGFGGALGLPPLVLAIGIPALLAAIAWVLTTYAKIRADLDFDRRALEAAEAGIITPGAAADLIRGRMGPGWLEQLGLGGAVGPWLLLGIGAAILWSMGARR